MTPGLELYPNGAGMLLAAAAVVVGAPLFSDGLRALRLRRHFAALRQAPLADAPTGFAHVRGTVSLESPMFAPLSGGACAGFRLEVQPAGYPAASVIQDHRRFRLNDAGRSARIIDTGALWDLPITAERDIAADQPLSERLNGLIARMPEARVARRAGRALHLVERSLAVGAECHVVGYARRARAFEVEPEMELQRTGTDDTPIAAVAMSAAEVRGEPDLWIGGENLDFLLVSDRAPAPARLAIPVYRTFGVVLGPLLSMAGLIYLAGALDALRALTRL